MYSWRRTGIDFDICSKARGLFLSEKSLAQRSQKLGGSKHMGAIFGKNSLWQRSQKLGASRKILTLFNHFLAILENLARLEFQRGANRVWQTTSNAVCHMVSLCCHSSGSHHSLWPLAAKLAIMMQVNRLIAADLVWR